MRKRIATVSRYHSLILIPIPIPDSRDAGIDASGIMDQPAWYWWYQRTQKQHEVDVDRNIKAEFGSYGLEA